MKIVMIGQKGVPGRFGGIETHVTELSTRLARLGHSVVCYARRWYVGPKPARLFNRIQVITIPTLHTKHLDAIVHTALSTIHALIFVRPDVYHFHGVGPSLLSFLPRLLSPRAQVISTFHCVDRNHAKWGFIARLALRFGEWASLTFAHETIVVSKTLRVYANVEYGKRATYVPNGITPRRLATDPTLLSPFSLEPYYYVAMVSRLVPHKGAHILIEAWKKAKEQAPIVMKDLKLAIVGDSAFTDNYVATLRAAAFGDSSIVFTGFQAGDTLDALFQGARFLVHPSMSEGLPIAVLEAMSFGKTVVAADIAENLEVVREHGVAFETNNIDDLANKIIEIAGDPMRAAAIGHLARTFVENDYNWDDIAQKTIAIYQDKRAVPHGLLAIR